ncbi:MAG: NAD-dependent epimerase/dehydratase family protein [Ruthenibacterium sp.]
MCELYLVTGAAGHLGGVVVQKLLAQNKHVRILLLPDEAKVPPQNVAVFHGNVCDKKSLQGFFSFADTDSVTVIHCAGIVTIQSHYDCRVADVNVGGTQNIIDLCFEKKVHRLVYVSSVHAIPELPAGEVIAETDVFSPDGVVGLYAKTKAEASARVLDAAHRGLPASVVQPSGIIGPYDTGGNHLTAMIQSFCRSRLPIGVDGGYDFVDVRDVADGVLACAAQGKTGECYILSGHYASIRTVFTQLAALSHRKVPRIYLPLSAAKAFASAVEEISILRHKRPLLTAYSIYTLGTNAHFSHQKASEQLGYTPRPLAETLADTVQWLAAQKQ